MLAGGNTPLPAYRALAARCPPHDDGLQVLFSDERYVPRGFPREQLPPVANRCWMCWRSPEEALLRVRTELPLERRRHDYERAHELLAVRACAS